MIVQSHSYHINMMLIFKFFASHVFIYTISSMIILAFQTGYLEVTGKDIGEELFEETTQAIRAIQSIFFSSSHLFSVTTNSSVVSSCWQPSSVLPFCPSKLFLKSQLCERVAATVFIDDYETCNRPHIAVTLLTIVSSCSLLISIQINFCQSRINIAI